MKPSKNFRPKRKKKQKKSFLSILLEKFGNYFAFFSLNFISVIDTFSEVLTKISTKLFSKKFIRKYFELFQLTIIYIFPFISLFFSTYRTAGHEYGFFVTSLIPYSKLLLSSRFAQFFGDPNQSFLLYYLIFDTVLRSKLYNFTTLVKFHLLFSVTLEMFHSLTLMYLEMFCFVENSLGEIFPIVPQTEIAYYYTVIFLAWYVLYLCCYITALRGKFPNLGNSDYFAFFQRIIDSIAFWLKVKRIK
jgi:hypothetical protein